MWKSRKQKEKDDEVRKEVNSWCPALELTDEVVEWLKEHPAVRKYFQGHKRALMQFTTCFGCRFMYIYKSDVMPYGKCIHKERPLIRLIAGRYRCDRKKIRIGGEYLGIKIPALKK